MTFSGVNTVVMDKIGAKGHFNLIYNQVGISHIVYESIAATLCFATRYIN